MCVIAVIPKGKTLSKKDFYDAYTSNPDGVGLMYADNGKIRVYKSAHDADLIYKLYTRVKAKKECILHFRYTTHGKNDFKNTHPFMVNKNLAFCHNGIISDMEISESKSDTVMFRDTVLKTLDPDFLDDVLMVDYIKDIIGGGSKLVFLDDNGKVTIVNKELGKTRDDGIWLSSPIYDRTYFNSVWKDYDSDFDYDEKTGLPIESAPYDKAKAELKTGIPVYDYRNPDKYKKYWFNHEQSNATYNDDVDNALNYNGDVISVEQQSAMREIGYYGQ